MTAHRRLDDPLEPLRSRSWLVEARRKAIHLSFMVLPLDLLFELLPWPRGKREWRLFLIALSLGAITIDLFRIHERRVRQFFREFFGRMIREHEEFSLMGSTYLLIASLLSVEIFSREVAAAAIGFTVIGDAFAAMVGKAWGRRRFFRKTLEGALGGLAACLAWAALLAGSGHLPWGVAVAGAVAASLVELLPIPLDDNLGMTLVSGYAMKLLAGS
ncbi:MAG TPA: phosphatidate cytidylyltransferase [Candidatus Udaeobacter sp.]|jgi:dolichol kinase|nr:phosphatidate cytidylyltransferase [Candidatus Udaeobacter sp.]